MELRAMTFNVRQADGDDGHQSWEFRCDALAKTIRRCMPDILGTQEAFPEQIAFIHQQFPQFNSFGIGRFGDDQHMHNRIFFNSERFSLLENGDFWLSTTPDIPGSKDWGIPRPRLVSWGRLAMSDGFEVLVMCTHFPYHRGAEEARRESARLVRAKIDAVPQDMPVLLFGDFNAPAGGEVYQSLTETLHDVWTDAGELRGPETTVHGYGKYEGARIDWILYRFLGEVLWAETVTDRPNGLFPSDHYPVLAVFSLTERSAI